MRWALLRLLAVLSAAAPAGAQSAKPQTTSLDSEAPPGAPPHWLPNERWVMQHWIPYDETRLHRLLGVTRDDVWRWLRDDTRNVADLAAQRGWEARALSRANWSRPGGGACASPSGSRCSSRVPCAR